MTTREVETPEEVKDLTSLWPVVDGMSFPPQPPGRPLSWEEHISSIRHLKLRDDDILICAYPKAGTHWLWEVCSMLLQGKADYESRPKEQLMIEFVDVKKLDEMPSPRILNTHLPFSMLPVQEMKAKRIKVVHVYRNPKDTVVSYYHMLRIIQRSGVTVFDQFFDVFLSDKAIFGSYFNFLRQMHEFTKKNPDVPVLSISFEDMKKKALEKVKEVAQFLEPEVTESLCEEVEVACRFDNLKKHVVDKKRAVPAEEPIEQPLTGTTQMDSHEKLLGDGSGQVNMFRKGQVGDWKNYLTVAMSERMDQLTKEKMKGLPFTIQF